MQLDVWAPSNQKVLEYVFKANMKLPRRLFFKRLGAKWAIRYINVCAQTTLAQSFKHNQM
jgi:hypothetical protein